MSKPPESFQYRATEEFRLRMKELMGENDCERIKDFAKLLGVGEPVISKAINFGILPSTKTLIKIADKLEVSILYLAGISDENDFTPSESVVTFHERLKQLANERHEKFGKIGGFMSFPKTYFYEWMKDGSLPYLSYVIEIANYFEVSPDYLLGRTDYKK